MGRRLPIVVSLLVATGALTALPVADAEGGPAVGTWSGTPTGIAGTSRYDGGEWIHTDFVFDDYGADTTRASVQPQLVALAPTSGDFRYPEGDRYRSNAADVVEVRARIVGDDDLQLRVLLSTLVDATVPAIWVSLDGEEQVVTADDAAVDEAANVVTFVVADAAAGDTVELNVGAGLHDGAGDLLAGSPGSARLQPEAFTTGAPTDARLFDLAFNTEDLEGRGGAWNEDVQSERLHSGDLDPFAQTIDLSALRHRATTPVPVEPGYHVRVFESRQDLGEGVGSSFPQYRSRFQPYAYWIPEGYDPAKPTALFLSMHSLSFHHNQYRGGDRPSASFRAYYEQFGDANGAVVVTPLGRGPDGWYEAEALVDTLEVWADALGRFAVNPDRVSAGGYSMGGYGTYRLTTLMPDAFAAAVVMSGPMTNGVELAPARNPAPDNTYDQLASARHVPTWIVHGTNDELVPATGVAQQADRYAELGHEHRFALYPGHGHFTMPFTHEWVEEATWVRAHPVRRENPGRVTLAIRPASLATGIDEGSAPIVLGQIRQLAREVGARVDGGYWVSGVALAAGADIGLVDLRSGRRPVLAATPLASADAASDGAYVLTGADQAPTPTDGRDVLQGTLSGVRELTVDLHRAGLSDDPDIEVVTEDQVTIRLVRGDQLVATHHLQPATG